MKNIILPNSACFISGIDTACGKTYMTGKLSAFLLKTGKKVITMKPVQTGQMKGKISEDIIEHRKLENRNPLEEDFYGITSPYIFRHPCSPHLAAKLENKSINPSIIAKNTETLQQTFEIVLIEGSGGLKVPLKTDYSFMDYIKEFDLPLILVSSSRLGSINHTLLSLESCYAYGINLLGVIYNVFPQDDEIIAKDTLEIIKNTGVNILHF